jgi:hypothetical protein
MLWRFLEASLEPLQGLKKNIAVNAKSRYLSSRVRICKPFQEPKNRFPAWRAVTTTLFDVPARQDTWVGGIDSLESIPGLLKSLKNRALYFRQ